MNGFFANWQKWSTGQGGETINIRGQGVKGQGHTTPKLALWPMTLTFDAVTLITRFVQCTSLSRLVVALMLRDVTNIYGTEPPRLHRATTVFLRPSILEL